MDKGLFYKKGDDSQLDSKFLENSMTENLLISSSRRTINMQDELESVFDFKQEIERRYKNSFANKIYAFPRKMNTLQQSDSSDSSFASLENINFYDLNNQNQKKNKI